MRNENVDRIEREEVEEEEECFFRKMHMSIIKMCAHRTIENAAHTRTKRVKKYA